MPHLDARAISRIAQNPRCHLQAGMLLLGLQEQETFRLLTGKPYPGPRGDRSAALAWGRLFEARLTENQARRLLVALDGMLGIRATSAHIRDLRAEIPDAEDDAVSTRATRTREILADLLDGRPVPDLVLQPCLVLKWRGADWGYIAPDALALDRSRRRYVPLEAKGYIALDGMITPGERAAVRLQAAVEIVALRSELVHLDPAAEVPPQALLIVATPFGFRPAPSVLEELDAETVAVEVALRTIAQVFSRLAIQRTVPLRERLLGLPIHLQDSCLASCALAGVCRARAPRIHATFGDHVAALLGERVDLDRLICLLCGEPAASPEEADLQEALKETATLYQWR
jgi:hypothetical protein